MRLFKSKVLNCIQITLDIFTSLFVLLERFIIPIAEMFFMGTIVNCSCRVPVGNVRHDVSVIRGNNSKNFRWSANAGARDNNEAKQEHLFNHNVFVLFI